MVLFFMSRELRGVRQRARYIVALHFLQYRTFFAPSSRDPIRVGSLQLEQINITFEAVSGRGTKTI